jgi:hypothetical protein
MASLADIPVEHLKPGQDGAFLDWLTDQPISFYNARSFMRLWASATGQKFTATQWAFVFKSFRRGHGN